MKKTVDNRVSGWYNNQRRQGRHTSFGGLAQLGARLVSKHTPSQIVLRQSNSQQKTPSKRFASWILWGISSAGRALAWHARGQRFDPAILHQKSTVFRLKYGAFLFTEADFWGLYCFACTIFRLLQAVPIQPPIFDFTSFSKRNVCRPVVQQTATSSPLNVPRKIKVAFSGIIFVRLKG